MSRWIVDHASVLQIVRAYQRVGGIATRSLRRPHAGSLTVWCRINPGCPRFGASFFLRLTWDTSN